MDFGIFQGQELAVEVEEKKSFEPFKEDGAVCEIIDVAIFEGEKEWNLGQNIAKLTIKVVQSKHGNENRQDFKEFNLDDERGLRSLMQSVFNVDQQLANDTIAAAQAAGDDAEKKLAAIENMLVALKSFPIAVNFWTRKGSGKHEGKVFQSSKIKGLAILENAIEAEDAGLAF